MTDESSGVLAINSGSSSIKFSVYHMGRKGSRMLAGQIERIGQGGGFFHVKDADGKALIEQHHDMANHSVALRVLLTWLEHNGFSRDLDAVGHRVVHGGSKYTHPQLITPELITELRRLSPFAPEHLPRELGAIRAVGEFYPAAKQVACFDTSFHRNMPQVAQLYALPRHLWDEGVLRYGFHGLSYEYIVGELVSKIGSEGANARVIIAQRTCLRS